MYETRRRIYVTQEEGSSLAVIDMDRDAILKEMPTGGEPEGVLTSGGWRKSSLPSSEAGDLVHEVDTASGAITRGVTVGLAPDGKDLWVTAELSGTAFIVDRAEVVFTGSVPFLPPGMRKADVTPVGIAMAKDDKTAYVALGHAAHVAVDDAATRKVLGYILCRQNGSPSRATRRRSMSPMASVMTCRSSTPQGESLGTGRASSLGIVRRRGTTTTGPVYGRIQHLLTASCT